MDNFRAEWNVGPEHIWVTFGLVVFKVILGQYLHFFQNGL